MSNHVCAQDLRCDLGTNTCTCSRLVEWAWDWCVGRRPPPSSASSGVLDGATAVRGRAVAREAGGCRRAGHGGCGRHSRRRDIEAAAGGSEQRGGRLGAGTRCRRGPVRRWLLKLRDWWSGLGLALGTEERAEVLFTPTTISRRGEHSAVDTRLCGYLNNMRRKPLVARSPRASPSWLRLHFLAAEVGLLAADALAGALLLML